MPKMRNAVRKDSGEEHGVKAGSRRVVRLAAHEHRRPDRPPTEPAEPPPAKQVPHERTYHGDTVTDEYAWLADKDDPDTIAYLKAENAYTEAATAGLAPLQEQIFAEIKARTQESDLSVPVRKGDWWQYARTVEGQQYAVHCRRAVRPGEVIPPLAEDGQPLDGEEVLLDGNELAAGAGFFALGAYQPSPDWRWLAYSTDFSGDERFTIRIKDLATGALLPDEIPGAYYGCSWSLDGSVLFYVTVDDAWRPYRVWRHRIGTPADQDVMLYEEADRRFNVDVGHTRSERYIVIHSASVLTSEVWLLDAAAPEGELTVVTPRRQGLDYSVDDAGDRLLILHNDHAENFEIATAPLSAPQDWTPLVPHRADTRLLGMAAFADFIVVYFRRDGLTGLRILDSSDAAGAGGEREIAFAEPIYRVGPGPNPEYHSSPVPPVLHLAGHAGLGLRLRHGHRRADPAQAPAGAALPVGRAVPARGLRAAPRVGRRGRRHADPDLAGVP